MAQLSVAPGRSKINLAATILIILGIVVFILDLTAINQASSSPVGVHRLNINGIIYFVLGVILKCKGYKSARRITFLVSVMFAFSLFKTFGSLYSIYLWDIPLGLYKALLLHDGAGRLLTNIIYFFVILSVYRLLSSESIRAEALDFNVPYQPAWRYSPHRGFVAIMIAVFFIFIISAFKTPKLIKTVTPPVANAMQFYDSFPGSDYLINDITTSHTSEGDIQYAVNIVHYNSNNIVDIRPLVFSVFAEDGKRLKDCLAQAENNDTEAQLALGSAYSFGLGVKTDREVGLKWMLRAAKGGNKRAQLFVAQAYHLGFGVEKDEVKSKFWRTEAETI
ncbi:MAG: hypothetical protein CMF50_02630 [Legionellales bacterium]|nr:hypothetical protein [Legionellales bacterium]|tara:strand:- start:5448 stop:6452 length:1005 start_codon:yes stop_codon:yes gene_type:complete